MAQWDIDDGSGPRSRQKHSICVEAKSPFLLITQDLSARRPHLTRRPSALLPNQVASPTEGPVETLEDIKKKLGLGLWPAHERQAHLFVPRPLRLIKDDEVLRRNGAVRMLFQVTKEVLNSRDSLVFRCSLGLSGPGGCIHRECFGKYVNQWPIARKECARARRRSTLRAKSKPRRVLPAPGAPVTKQTTWRLSIAADATMPCSASAAA